MSKISIMDNAHGVSHEPLSLLILLKKSGTVGLVSDSINFTAGGIRFISLSEYEGEYECKESF